MDATPKPSISTKLMSPPSTAAVVVALKVTVVPLMAELAVPVQFQFHKLYRQPQYLLHQQRTSALPLVAVPVV